jgi:hypothetical protein
MTSCISVVHQSFGESYCLHPQGRRVSQASRLLCLIPASLWFLTSLTIDSEDGGDICLWNIGLSLWTTRGLQHRRPYAFNFNLDSRRYKIFKSYNFITHSLTHGAEPFLRSSQLFRYSRTYQHFMELEGSSPCSQEPSPGLYPEPDQFSPYHHILSLYVPF